MTSADELAAAYDAALSDPEALAALCTIETADGPVPFTFWQHQRDIVNLMRENDKVIVLKARQLGVSWVMCVYALWHALANPGTLTLMISIGDREAQELVRRIRTLWESIPYSFRKIWKPTIVKHRLTFRSPAGESSILSIPSGDSAGRGLQSSLVIGDEAAFWERSSERLAALIPTMADSGQIILCSTANGMTGSFFTTYNGAPENGWSEYFVGALARPGRDDNWVASQRQSLGDLGAQEYPLSAEECFISTSRNVFDTADLLSLKALANAPAPWRGELFDDGSGAHARPMAQGSWKVWEWPIAGREYIITGDPSGGLGSGDYSAMAVYDKRAWTQVAAFHAKVDPSQFAHIMQTAGWLWQSGPGEPALLIPEGNNHGQAVVALLRDGEYPKVYRHARMDLDSMRESAALGWYTTVKTKPLMISSLAQAIREKEITPRDTLFYEEAATYLLDPAGRMNAADGHHDDCLMTHAIAAVILQHTSVGVELPRTPSTLRALPR
jgi:hypothetical protein